MGQDPEGLQQAGDILLLQRAFSIINTVIPFGHAGKGAIRQADERFIEDFQGGIRWGERRAAHTEPGED